MKEDLKAIWLGTGIFILIICVLNFFIGENKSDVGTYIAVLVAGLIYAIFKTLQLAFKS
jgi:Na+/melibiose symporter-like transporter